MTHRVASKTRTKRVRVGLRAALALGILIAASHEASASAQVTSPFLHGESTHPWTPSGDSLGTTYNGGRVLGDVQIVAVFWGPNVSPTITSGIGGFYSAIVQASQIGWLCEYNTPSQSIMSGSFAGNFTITPTVNTSNSITDANVQAELGVQINAGHLPVPNPNTIYMVHFPPSLTITSSSGTSCVDFCAYHDAATATIGGQSVTFPYAVLPDFTQTCTCGDRSAFDNFTKSVSHELSEAITDTVPGTAWTNSRGEIGDSCNYATLGDGAYYNFTSGGVTYAAQLEWSRNTNGCVPGSQCKTCNPFQASCTTTIAPDVPFSGSLFFSVTSSGCASTGPRSCNNSITLTPGTTITQKCTALVNAINSDCGAATAKFQADSSQCGSGTFTVTDQACNAQAPTGNGVTLMLANAQNTLQGSGMLADYEQDVITNGCQGGGDSVALLGGSPTGTPINGSQSSVVFIVTTPDIGQVIETVPTTAQMSVSSIVSNAVSRANATLTAFNSTVRCTVDPNMPTVAGCTSTPRAVDAGEGDTPASGVPVSFQLNDTGTTRAMLTGPAKDVASAKQAIQASGGISNVLQTNFAGGPVCSPCNGGTGGSSCCSAKVTTVPALPGLGVYAVGALLAAAGVAFSRRGRVPRRAGS